MLELRLKICTVSCSNLEKFISSLPRLGNATPAGRKRAGFNAVAREVLALRGWSVCQQPAKPLKKRADFLLATCVGESCLCASVSAHQLTARAIDYTEGGIPVVELSVSSQAHTPRAMAPPPSHRKGLQKAHE